MSPAFAKARGTISLKGVGKTTAHNIIKFRTTAGNITQETLKDISGIHVSSELLAGIDFSINLDLYVPREEVGQGESQKVVTQQEVIKKLEKAIEAHTGGESQGQGQPKVSLAVSKHTHTQGAIPKGSNSKFITSMSSMNGSNQQNDTGLNTNSPPSMLEASAMGYTPYNVGITTPTVTVWPNPPRCMSYPPPGLSSGIQSCMTPCSQGIGYGPIPNFQPQYGLPNFRMAPPLIHNVIWDILDIHHTTT